jgi:hypothetical protein
MNKVSKSCKNLSIFVLILILSIGVLPGVSNAERVVVDYGYTKTIGNSGYDAASGVTTDSSGNVYTTGQFQNTVDFDPGVGTDEHTSNGNNDIYITKINTDGSYGWTKTMGGSSDESTYGSVADNDGNFYITGIYQSPSVDFDPGVGTDIYTQDTETNKNFFLTKINTNGSYGYTKIFENSREVGAPGGTVKAVTADILGNVYLTGYIANGDTVVDFDPSENMDIHTNLGNADAFYTKINADGSYGYTKVISEDTFGNIEPSSIVVDSDGGVYIGGSYYDGGAILDFDPGVGTDTQPSRGNTDSFFSKFNADGSYVFTKTFGSVNQDFTVIGVDSLEDIYMAGYFSGTVDFDPSIGTDERTDNGGIDIYLTKINADGSYGWTKTIGGAAYDWVQSIAIGSEDSVYITGDFENTVDFDPTEGIDSRTCTNIEYSDCFYVTKFDEDGSYQYTKTIIGVGESYDYSYDITIDLYNDIFLFGQFYSASLDFDPSEGVDIHTNHVGDQSSTDIFLTKFSQSTYHHINSLSGLVAETTGGTSVDDESVDDGILEDATTTVRIKDDTLPLADISTTFASDLDWSSITGASDTTNYKSFVHNLTSVDGADDTFTLYVPHRRGDTSVAVCPGATSLEIVTDSCENVVTYREGVSDVSVVTINDTNFWSVPNQTGTGGISMPPVRMTSGSRPKSSTVAFVSPVIPSTSSGKVIPEVQTCTLTLLLKQSSRGEEVKCLQTLLSESLKLSLVTDGMFGPKTKASVILFQKANGLIPDGIVGPLTRGKLN